MTTGLTYSSYVTQIATMAVVDEADANFQIILPQMITYAENRMCRDLDFLEFSDVYTGASLAAGNRTLTIPAGTFVTIEQANVITPSGTTNPESATASRNPCEPTTKEFLDAVYGSNVSTYRALPRYFVPFNDNILLFGPVPDQAYTIEVVGMVRPASLSASNTTTFISTYLPDLFLMASMIYISAYQRNFGRQSDDPQMAQSYEAQYKALLQGAVVEEARKKFEAAAWSSQAPAVVASPTRG